MRMVASEASSTAAVSEEGAMEKGRNTSRPVKALQEDMDRLEALGIARDAGKIAADGILVNLDAMRAINPRNLIYGKACRR
ncbi:hypothetical protein IEQ34_017251 [Dendrobium chrysotoxum]|uniref:Uncharacterized protein n=1 Tax=Dendrobium chrysotoxum TaxID=161865 RepID=A0AAV7GBH8_DENCH|nr:hypothetical protein IEQ34_017251 [Dendrobium chrysotoxum]